MARPTSLQNKIKCIFWFPKCTEEIYPNVYIIHPMFPLVVYPFVLYNILYLKASKSPRTIFNFLPNDQNPKNYLSHYNDVPPWPQFWCFPMFAILNSSQSFCFPEKTIHNSYFLQCSLSWFSPTFLIFPNITSDFPHYHHPCFPTITIHNPHLSPCFLMVTI